MNYIRQLASLKNQKLGNVSAPVRRNSETLEPAFDLDGLCFTEMIVTPYHTVLKEEIPQSNYVEVSKAEQTSIEKSKTTPQNVMTELVKGDMEKVEQSRYWTIPMPIFIDVGAPLYD
eukprot:TRINITY_DN988_c0_g1_i1.p7 TRINITY_DN988_c0_g1~~TRINITY_DN988_c0_g1_i1.p7  ORF type:complete len:117 (-),score=15.04 TRINITY_DN988_c0_g1_i1:1901-2251(-)